MTILPDLCDLVIDQVSITNEVTITVRAASTTAQCPCCGTISKRVQSRYTRTLRDLPASGRLVHLIVRVRRFFCQQSTSGLTLPWSQGPLEGHINRLKLIKRSMYGRAKLHLLRARVLHVAQKEPSRAAILAGE